MTDAQNIIADVLSAGGAPCVTASFQAECVVLVHMLIERRPGIPVLFLDTGYHFAETLAYRDELAARWRLNLVNLTASQPVSALYRSDPDRCCAIHKVEPLFAGLEAYDVWFTALRREQSPTRANLKEIDAFRLPSGKELKKVSPLASWTAKDVWGYARHHDIPLLPLYERGYTSIGCEPCTALPFDPSNPRSGRWQGKKLECGIHIQQG